MICYNQFLPPSPFFFPFCDSVFFLLITTLNSITDNIRKSVTVYMICYLYFSISAYLHCSLSPYYLGSFASVLKTWFSSSVSRPTLSWILSPVFHKTLFTSSLNTPLSWINFEIVIFHILIQHININVYSESHKRQLYHYIVHSYFNF